MMYSNYNAALLIRNCVQIDEHSSRIISRLNEIAEMCFFNISNPLGTKMYVHMYVQTVSGLT